MSEARIIERLDKLTAVLRLAHHDDLETARNRIRAHKIDAAILDATKRWTSAKKVQAAVRKKKPASERAIQVHAAALIDQGLLEKRGGGQTTAYRSTGVV